MAGNYHLSVTAGPDYDLSSQQLVHVNTDQSTTFSTSQIDASITFRIQNYRGLPTDSPKTCNYFSAPGHKADLFSLQFSFVPKSDINGNDVVLGNDFDYPIRDGLPPGADQAFKIAKWFIDPGMYADVKADKPHVFGPLLSSINTFRIDGDDSSLRQTKDGTDTVQEGTTNGAESERVKSGLPSTAAARKKHFLDKKHLESFTFKAGTRYTCDFFNPYLDFNDFSVKLPTFGVLPGITIPVIDYWDGQPLRFVLKNRATDKPLIVIILNLIPIDPATAPKRAHSTPLPAAVSEAKTHVSDQKQSKDANEAKTEIVTNAETDLD